MANVGTRQRGMRREWKGAVVSKSGNKSVVVLVERREKHPLYGKIMRHTNKFHAHDEKNEAKLGDKVRIAESRPLSRLKRWRVVEILEKGSGAQG